MQIHIIIYNKERKKERKRDRKKERKMVSEKKKKQIFFLKSFKGFSCLMYFEFM